MLANKTAIMSTCTFVDVVCHSNPSTRLQTGILRCTPASSLARSLSLIPFLRQCSVEDFILSDPTLDRGHRHAGTIRLDARLATLKIRLECRSTYFVCHDAARVLTKHKSTIFTRCDWVYKSYGMIEGKFGNCKR